MPTNMNRRAALGVALASTALPLLGGLARAETLPLTTVPGAPFAEVEAAHGKIRGGTARGALAFKGVPYGGSLSGANRFRRPAPVRPWTGVFDATQLGPPSIQRPGGTYGDHEPAHGEDCLVLNVWTPAADGKKRPVMVYLHGGGFVSGSGGSPTQDGGRLAAVYDVVVVACNHRLGLLGYLFLGDYGDQYAANAGMLDIVQSLRWVKDNIAAFGGDPDNVTVLGESGGGGKVGTLLAMPEAQGLFHKAGIESGAWTRRMTRERASETARRLLKALDIRDPAKLADVPVQTLLDWQVRGEDGQAPLADPDATGGRMTWAGYGEEQVGHFGPVVDGQILPRHPFEPDVTPLAAHIPLLIAHNNAESAFGFRDKPEIFDLTEDAMRARLSTEFGGKAEALISAYRASRPGATPSQLYIAITTARQFGNDTVTVASRKSMQPAPVWFYRWDYNANVPVKGSTTGAVTGPGHASDIAPTFYNWDEHGLHGDGPGVEAASRNLSSIWTRFARTGVPSCPGVTDWPPYDTRTRPVLLVDTACRVVNDPDGAARKVWGIG